MARPVVSQPISIPVQVEFFWLLIAHEPIPPCASPCLSISWANHSLLSSFCTKPLSPCLVLSNRFPSPNTSAGFHITHKLSSISFWWGLKNWRLLGTQTCGDYLRTLYNFYVLYRYSALEPGFLSQEDVIGGPDFFSWSTKLLFISNNRYSSSSRVWAPHFCGPFFDYTPFLILFYCLALVLALIVIVLAAFRLGLQWVECKAAPFYSDKCLDLTSATLESNDFKLSTYITDLFNKIYKNIQIPRGSRKEWIASRLPFLALGGSIFCLWCLCILLFGSTIEASLWSFSLMAISSPSLSVLWAMVLLAAIFIILYSRVVFFV